MKRLEQTVGWEQIVAALERLKQEKWEAFARRHGDWGRDAALWLARRHSGLRLGQLGRLVGDLDYAAVSQAVRRFGQRLKKDAKLRTSLVKVEEHMSNVDSAEKPRSLIPVSRWFSGSPSSQAQVSPVE